MDAEDLDYYSLDILEKLKTHHFPNEREIKDLIRDMDFAKSSAKLFIFRMKQWNLVKDVQVTSQRSRHEPFLIFYNLREGFCFCHEVPELFGSIEASFVPKDWQLFIDIPTTSLKAALLHNGDNYLTLPLTHSVCLKEGYYSVKTLLEALQYNQHNWEINMVALLLRLQGSFVKFKC